MKKICILSFAVLASYSVYAQKEDQHHSAGFHDVSHPPLAPHSGDHLAHASNHDGLGAGTDHSHDASHHADEHHHPSLDGEGLVKRISAGSIIGSQILPFAKKSEHFRTFLFEQLPFEVDSGESLPRIPYVGVVAGGEYRFSLFSGEAGVAVAAGIQRRFFSPEEKELMETGKIDKESNNAFRVQISSGWDKGPFALGATVGYCGGDFFHYELATYQPFFESKHALKRGLTSALRLSDEHGGALLFGYSGKIIKAYIGATYDATQEKGSHVYPVSLIKFSF